MLTPLGLACLFIGLGRVQTAAVRGRAAHALRRRRLLEEEPDAARRRDLAAVSLVLPAIVCAFLLVPLATWIVNWERRVLDGLTEPAPLVDFPDSAGPQGRSATNASRPGATGRKAGTGSGAGTWDGIGSIDFESPDPWLDRSVLMEITPTAGGESTGDLGPLYLRGTPLIDVDGDWVEDISRVTRIVDADDGRADGWCDLAVRPNSADAMELVIHQEAPQYVSPKEIVIFAPPGTTSVQSPVVRAAPGGPVLIPIRQRVDSFDYRLAARLPTRVPYPGPGTFYASGDPRASAPPGRSPAWAELSMFARDATVGAVTDLDRVKAVVEFLQTQFKYERVNDPFARNDPLGSFLARKRGTCLEFAKAGVVMLRSLGVPARVGRGLLAGAWDEKRSIYVVRACDGHAWIEVAFNGCGWVLFDAAPGAPDDWAWTRPDPNAGTSSGIGDAASSGWFPRLDQTLGGAGRGAARLLDLVMEHPFLALTAVALAAALVVHATRRRARRLAGERVSAPLRRGPWDRLSSDLARRGFRRGRSQTALEFADLVVAAGGDLFAPLLALTERQQSARFRGVPLTPDDDEAIAAFRATLAESKPR